MSRIIRKACSSCGSSNLALCDILGRSFSFRDFEKVKITVPGVKLVQCHDCNEIHLNRKLNDAEALDQAIRKSLKDQVSCLIRQITRSAGISQTDLASRIGITASHLSRIKSGSEVPSFKTYNFLKVLAAFPQAIDISAPGSEPLTLTMFG